MDYVKQVLDALTLKPRALVGIMIATGTLTLAPRVWLNKLGLAAILDTYRGWFGAALVASSALLLSYGVVSFWNKARVLWRVRADVRRIRRRLTSLHPSEQMILAPYVRSNTTTMDLDITNGPVASLIQKNLLYRASNFVIYPGFFKVGIQPVALEHLRQHPEMVGLTEVSEDASLGHEAPSSSVSRGSFSSTPKRSS